MNVESKEKVAGFHLWLYMKRKSLEQVSFNIKKQYGEASQKSWNQIGYNIKKVMKIEKS